MKDKPFVKFLKRWFQGEEFEAVHIAKCLSSMLTHSLIQMEKMSAVVYSALDIQFQIEWLKDFIEGNVSEGELISAYKDRFYKFII